MSSGKTSISRNEPVVDTSTALTRVARSLNGGRSISSRREAGGCGAGTSAGGVCTRSDSSDWTLTLSARSYAVAFALMEPSRIANCVASSECSRR
eukprot:6398913-Prymnesium_polylepis.1